MVELNSTAFVAITGNGLTPSLDLVRRFVTVELDPKCEDPESRPFRSGFLDGIEKQRPELLSAAITIWRWGRQNRASLRQGKPLGSYEEWCEWVRDPLVALGCSDPVEQIAAVKANDPARMRIMEIFHTWWRCYRNRPVKVSDLDEEVRKVIDPQSRGRQYLANQIARLSDTRAAGMVLNRQKGAGKYAVSTYSITRTDGDGSKDPTHVVNSDRGSQATRCPL
jgi:hypothetical protein